MPRLPEPARIGCPMCGYDLSATPEADGFHRCPECGSVWSQGEVDRGIRAPLWVVLCGHILFGLGGAVVGGFPTFILCGLWLVAGFMSAFGNQSPPSFLVIAPFLVVLGALWMGLMIGAAFAFRRIFRFEGDPARKRSRVRRHLLLVVFTQIVATVVVSILFVRHF